MAASEWRTVELGQVVEPVNRREIPRSATALPYIGLEHVASGSGVVTAHWFASSIKSSSPLVDRGDVLYGRLRPYLNKVTIAPFDAYASGEFIVFKPNEHLEASYLRWLLASHEFVSFATSLNAGDRPRVKWNQIRSFRFELPSLSAQRRIVDILEGHFSRLDAASEGVRSAASKLRAMRASALGLSTDYNGSKQPLAELASDSGYGTSTKCAVDGSGAVVVRIPNLVDGRIDLTDSKKVVDRRVDVSNFELRTGDLLIVRTNGSRELIGRAAVVGPGIDAAFASYLIRYRLRTDVVRPNWVLAMLSSPRVRAQIEGAAASSAGQYNLSLAKLGPIQIPTPDIEEQDVRLAALQATCADVDRLSRAVEANCARTASLRRALLTGAFTGQLTGHPSDTERIEEMADASGRAS